MEKKDLFEKAKPPKALAMMALPTIASQIVVLVYNLADTWFIGRTNNPYMVGASSLALTVYLAVTALANVFGVGGGSLMVRLIGEKKEQDARRVASYSVAAAAVSALAFSLLTLFLMDPLLKLLGASSNTLPYAKQYVLATTVFGGIPTVLSMAMPQMLRNAGFSKEAGLGVGIGSLLNVLLDPVFMFVLLPKGSEVLGAGIATMLSNCVSLLYFIVMYRKLRNKTVLSIPHRIEKISSEQKRSLYSVGIPAAFAIFLFDLVTIVINRLTASYGDTALAAMGIVLKLERIPIQVGLGVCLGMVPLVAYNYGAGNSVRMRQFVSLARIVILGFSCACAILFWAFAKPLVSAFIADDETVSQGILFLRGRCLSLPFMMIGYHIVNYMNAVDKGKVSFLLALLRHIVLIIPVMILMNLIWGLAGLVWSQLAADFLNAVAAFMIYRRIDSSLSSTLPPHPKG
ncbi:MAG: MATE family efflux transporter [Clostridia bacterium]|nr:MATE family efflux transporter [Clostridia bacterium]